MTDILGPGSNTFGVATSRPADGRVMGASDTYHQDCSTALANDGTPILAAVLNDLLDQDRNVIRGNGALAAGGPVVAEDNSAAMMLNAILHLIQRGKMHLATDVGAANVLEAQMSPAPPEIVDGMLVVMRPAAANAGSSTLKVGGVTKAIVTAAGAALGGGELVPPNFYAFRYNGALGKWQLASAAADAGLLRWGIDVSTTVNRIAADVEPSFSVYKPGMLFAAPPAAPNTGAAKANFDARGLKDIVLNASGAALSGGELSNVGGYVPLFLYDAAGLLRLINPLSVGVRRIAPYTASGSFTPQTSLIFAMFWASGAAGRNVTGSSYAVGRGGHPGEFRFGFFQVQPGVSIPITIPAGAVRGSNGNGAAASLGSLMTAMGGTSTGPGTGGSGGYGFTGSPGRNGYTTGNVVNAIIVIGEGGVPFLSGIYGGGGDGGDGGPSGDPLGRAGQDGFGLVLEMS